MRYEDSHTGAFQGSGPIANDDLDAVAAGSHSPATGNLITGEGTQTGSAGADSAIGAHITALAGKGGEDTSFSGGKLSVTGEHGKLSVDAEGNYSYQANAGVENVRDRFTYTLADNQGASDTASLIVEIGKTPVVIKANATQIVPGPDGVVTLPPGVELSDIRVVGRNLVIDMPDGTQLIIVDGAVFVPQLVLGGVEVPATNVAALLVGQEIQPAAGETPPSSGGNFDVPVPPLDPGVPLGDLIPPTEYTYTPPEPQPVDNAIDREPEIFIQPDRQPATVAAIDSVDEAGLPTRNGGEPAGSGESADGNGADNDVTTETTAGTIVYNSPDGVASITLNGVVITAVGQVIAGDFGNLTITSIAPGAIGYSYTLLDNTSGNDTHDDFSVTLTDNDGDTATATLVIDIIDDVPTARPDTDSIPAGSNGPATGNVMTDAAPGDAGDSDTNAADTVGADNARVTFIDSVNAAPGATVPDGGFVDIAGQYGTLRIYSNGDYSYIRGEGPPPGAVQDVFNYTLTDGDGDTSISTLTISITDFGTTIDAPDQGEAGTVVSEVGLPERNGGEPAGSGEIADGNGADNDDTSETTNGVINFSAPDGLGSVTIDGVAVTGVVGQTFAGTFGTLTITSFNVATGQIGYSYTLADNTSGNNTSDDFAIVVTDSDGDAASDTLVINIIDDVPTADNDTDTVAAGTFGPETGNVITGVGTTSGAAGDDVVGADDASITALVGFGGSSDNVFEGGVLEVNGQYGVLTIDADGNYSYTRNPGTPGGVEDVFTYTLTDGDGDSDTATLTITIEDAVPRTGENPTVLLDDDALANGNPGGTGDDPDSANTAGTLSGSGGDGALTFAVQLTGAPAGFTYVSGGAGIVLVQQGGETKLTVTVNSDGSYTVVQDNPIEHALGADENNVQFTINYTVTDADGDSAPGTFDINVDDDTPIATETQLGGTVDEDGVPGGIAGGTDDVAGENTVANGSVAALFSSGADVPLSYSLLSDTSGLPALTSGGVAVTYAVVGDTLTASAGGGTVFTFVLNADGSYTFTLVDQLDHPAGNDENDLSIQLGSIIQATDNDGDSVTANAGGLVITVDDDTPTASETLLTGTVDEDGVPGGIAGGPDDVPGAATVASGNVSSLFNSGADAPLTFSLLADTSGLPALTSGGVVVTYAVVGDTLAASAGGNDVFTFVLNANGSYTFTLLDQVDHPTLNGLPGDDTENDLSISLGSIIQATDADGDSVSANDDGLVIIVDDDTPVANNDVDSIAAGGDIATGNVITGANTDSGVAGADSPGADAPASITGLAGALTSDNNPAGGFVANGNYGVLTMLADGSYSYDRNDGAPGNVQDVFTYTYTDADGDSVTATLTINVADAAPNLPDPALVRLDDDALANGNAGGTGDDPDSEGLPGQLLGTGGDGDLDYNFTGINTLPAGFTANPVDASTVQILQGATVVLTITLNNEDGSFNVVQNNPIDHPVVSATEDNLQFSIGVEVEDADGDVEPATISINVDDDTPLASLNGQAALDTIVLDESRPEGTDTPGGVSPTGDASSTANFADNFTAPIAYGADGPGSVSYSLLLSANGIGSGLYALQPSDISAGDGDGYGQGAQITLSQVGDTITGSAGGTDYFTISINPATGEVTFTQLNPIWHPTPGSSFDETATLTTAAAANVQVVQTVTDGDGDTATAGLNIGQGVFSIQDDGPQAIQPDSATLENEVGASTTADLDDDGEVITDFGEDGPGLVQFANITNGDNSGLTSDGDAITYWLSNNGQTLEGRTNSTNGSDGELVMTVQINQATGDYTVTLADTIDNGSGISFDDLTSSAAGNVSFRGVGADDAVTTVDLLLSAGPGAGTTVNTDSDSIGAANQSMDNGELVRIDFVTNLTTDTADPDTPPTGFNYGAHVSSSEFLGFIPQVQGSQSETVAFTVWAIDSANTDASAPDRNSAGGFSDGTITTITDVTVQDYLTSGTTTVDVTGFTVGVFTAVAYGISVRVNADGSVSFSGIQQGDHYGFSTDGGDFNAVAVQALPTGTGGSSEDSFDLGVFSIGQVDTGDPINLSYDLNITDADGDTVTMAGAIDITINPADPNTLAATSFSSLSSQSEQLQKTAANSNTLTLAAAVAASGVVEAQAAAAPAHDSGSQGHQVAEVASSNGQHVAASVAAADDNSHSALSNEVQEAANDSALAASSSHGSSARADSDHSLDDSSANAAAQSSDHPAANDQGPASSPAAASLVAPSVGMPSAEALQAAGLTGHGGHAQHGGSVEQIVAEALGHGNAPATVDALLNALPGGNGQVAAIANVASPAAEAVPAWDMSMHGSFGTGHDVMMNVHAAMHHDAVQPAVNG
jgi:T1SS-143 domain-containing protein